MSDEYIVTDEMRDLIIKYMEALNEGDNAKAEGLLNKIRQENKNNDLT